MIDLLLRNARLVLPDGDVMNGALAIEDGRIMAVLQDSEAGHVGARETIELGGQHVLPGLIDTHFHGGFDSKENDLGTETRSAALGGVTTVCRYYRHLGSYGDTLTQEIDRSDGNSFVDYAIHLGLLTDDQLGELPRWVEEFGIRSFKMYTCYKNEEGATLGIRGQDDGFLLDAFRALAQIGGVVANVHCENQEIVDRSLARLKAAPQEGTDLASWSSARPPLAEAEAIGRVAFLAGDANAELFIPHVSSDAAVRAVETARAAGVAISAETCPHYLALDTDSQAGVLAKINPPVRPAGEADRLWDALRDGVIDVVGSDHGLTMRASKQSGDPWASAPGFTGAETILPILLGAGVARGRIDIGRIASIQARSADLFRLPHKGRIVAGADADLVIVDLDAERVVEADRLGSASDFSVFEGMRLRGWPTMTILRGRIIVRDGRAIGEPGGRYLRR